MGGMYIDYTTNCTICMNGILYIIKFHLPRIHKYTNEHNIRWQINK